MSKLESISAIDLDNVSGGFDLGGWQTNNYVTCRDQAGTEFNTKVKNAQRSWEWSPGAVDAFGKDLQSADLSCIAKNPIQGRRPGDLDI